MNTYDQAHALARALNTSEEYQAFLVAKQAVATNPQAQQMVKDFIARQMEVEYDRMSGKAEDKVKAEKLQQVAGLIALNPAARDFLQAYLRFQRVLADIYKILGESVAEGMDVFAKE